MGRPKTNSYFKTKFAIRIGELQKEYGYTDDYVINNVVNENGARIISDLQVLGSYKSGKRMPRDFYDVVKAFSKFYKVTTDYLIGKEDTKNHQIQHIKDVTGLSDAAIRKLMTLNIESSKYPGILEMIDAIISGTSAEDITYYINIYNQIYKDYKDSKAAVSNSNYDIEKMQSRFLKTQSLYSYWQSIVTQKLATYFDKQIQMEQDQYDYEHSAAYINNMIEQTADECKISEYILTDIDGKQIILKGDNYEKGMPIMDTPSLVEHRFSVD